MRAPVYVGRVWTNGDPFLLVDRTHAESWHPSDEEHLRLVAQLGAGETEIDVGSGRGVLLGIEYEDGTLEALRGGEGALLFVGVRYADELEYGAFLSDVAEVELAQVGALEVTSGELALLAAAAHWEDGSPVPEQEAPLPVTWGAPNDDILLLPMPPGRYELLGGQIDRETYGLDVWRLVSLSP